MVLKSQMDLARNNLDRSSSPYLRQHRDNPVWWQEWSAEIAATAAAQGKPLFVSVGYSTCHWCHVMAAEAFSDPDTARFLNDHFLCVKVDRETRPDIDQYLMRFAQEQNGGGGWPLNVFLTSDLRPVLALTYAPARPRQGMASLLLIAQRVLEYVRGHDREIVPFHLREEAPATAARERIADGLLALFDPRDGGFGAGPKFPPHSTLLYLLYSLCVEPHPGLERAGRLTLERMRRGGLHDHLQGGIYRYCVDREWTVPHFEKMLYDQAMALWWSALAARVLGDEAQARMAAGVVRCLEETFALDGLFAAAFDADTGHREGATYLWDAGEIEDALTPEEFSDFRRSYRLPTGGNFHGAVHLARLDDRPLPAVEEKLLARRRLRPQPGRDDKLLCGINALVACALTQAARLLGRPAWEERAAGVVRRLLEVFWDGRRLAHCLAAGELQQQEFLEDAAALLLAVTLLREGDDSWAAVMDRLGAYLASFRRQGRWIASAAADFREIDASWFDHPLPSPVSLAALATARAAVLEGGTAGVVDYRQPHQCDFFNVVALFTRGLFHQFHAPRPLDWRRLPPNSIQVRSARESDCYDGACRPINLKEIRR
jgi:hypothetical protein